ncbi:Arc family DNA-binding protein [Budvicia aquatica]|uniref:Arc family DNA-binding protein n=1 Tax=Budvicia aquatica TaxID=82979 RepID=UPI0021C26700|nr:Arc family DNA-binding protein [Budvicia aquatica]
MSDKRPYKHPQFNLRLPDYLKELISKRADLNRRSMNAEIVQILEDAVSRNESDDYDEVWKSLYFDNPDIDSSIDAQEKNVKIDEAISSLAENIANNSLKIEALLKLRRK